MLMTAKLDKPEKGESILEGIRKAAENKGVNIVYHVETNDKKADFDRAARNMPGTGARWLDMLCHGRGWSWHVWGDDIIVLEKSRQIKRQLKQKVSLRYQNAELVTVLHDLAGKARLRLTMVHE